MDRATSTAWKHSIHIREKHLSGIGAVLGTLYSSDEIGSLRSFNEQQLIHNFLSHSLSS